MNWKRRRKKSNTHTHTLKQEWITSASKWGRKRYCQVKARERGQRGHIVCPSLGCSIQQLVGSMMIINRMAVVDSSRESAKDWGRERERKELCKIIWQWHFRAEDAKKANQGYSHGGRGAQQGRASWILLNKAESGDWPFGCGSFLILFVSFLYYTYIPTRAVIWVFQMREKKDTNLKRN